MTTFNDYLKHRDPTGKEWARLTFKQGTDERLQAAKIEGLAYFLTWFKHRYPEFYYNKNGHKQTGHRMLLLYWADYLAWAER